MAYDAEGKESTAISGTGCRKIDIHCHTTNRRLRGLAVESATLDDILANMHSYDIEETFLLATYFPQKHSGISNFRLFNWIDGVSELAMFGSLDFEHYFFQGYNELEELAAEGKIRGIKIYTCYQNIDLLGEKMGMVKMLAARYKLPLMFHGGDAHKENKIARVSPLEIEQCIRGYAHPVIISHLANPYLDELIDVVRRNSHVYSDSSGLLNSIHRAEIPGCIEMLKRYVGECGPERLLFGTDFPLQTHADSVMMVEEALEGYSAVDKQKVYYENARRLLP